MTGYRDSDEWRAVELAVSNLLNRTNAEQDVEPGLVADFTLTLHEVPAGESDNVGAYAHYGSSAMPHVNEGLHRAGIRWWTETYGHDEG